MCSTTRGEAAEGRQPGARPGTHTKRKEKNTMTEAMRYVLYGKVEILVRHGAVTEMQKRGLGSRPTIRKALRGDYNENNADENRRAQRIRKYAYQEMAGVLVGAPVED